MTTSQTQQIKLPGKEIGSESQRPENASSFDFGKNLKLIKATVEKNSPNFNDVRAYAGLEKQIREKQTEPGRTPADKRIVQKLTVEQNGDGEKIQLAFDNLLKSSDVSKYAEDVITDIRKVDENLAQKLTDKHDLHHHEKYISQIKDKHPAKIIPQPISRPSISETKPDVQPIPLVENQPKADVGDQIITPEKPAEPPKLAEAVVEKNFTEEIVKTPKTVMVEPTTADQPLVEPEVLISDPVAAKPAEENTDKELIAVDEAPVQVVEPPKSTVEEAGETVMEKIPSVEEKINKWFDMAGKGKEGFTTADFAKMERKKLEKEKTS